MEVFACRCYRTVAERRLNQMQWRAVVESVRCMGVPQPVGANTGSRKGPQPGLFHNSEDSGPLEVLSGTRRKYWRVQPVTAPESNELAPHLLRQQDGARAATLPVDLQLTRDAARLQMSPP